VKIKRKGDSVRVELQTGEADMLATLLDQLTDLLVEANGDDPVIQRLYPDGYSDDAAASEEYRELVTADLQEQRMARIGGCRAELIGRPGRLELDPDGVDRWLRVLNDVRLTLGTRLGVTEETDLDPALQTSQVYYWLTAVQERLVETAMR
jgi:hypothetical protein